MGVFCCPSFNSALWRFADCFSLGRKVGVFCCPHTTGIDLRHQATCWQQLWQRQLRLRIGKENCSIAAPSKVTAAMAITIQSMFQADKITAGLFKRSVNLASTHCSTASPSALDRRSDSGSRRLSSLAQACVDTQKAIELGNALHGKKAWAYTHHHPQKKSDVWARLIRHYLERSSRSISRANDQNTSIEYMSQGLPCVIAVPFVYHKKAAGRTPGACRSI